VAIEKMFDQPYFETTPTKISCVRLVLRLPGAGAAKEFSLDVQHAQGEVQFGKASLRAFFSAISSVGLLCIRA